MPKTAKQNNQTQKTLPDEYLKEEEEGDKLRSEFEELEKKIRAHEEEIRLKYKKDYDRYSELFSRFTMVD